MIVGLTELTEKLKSLPEKVQIKILLPAVQRETERALQIIKNETPVESGDLLLSEKMVVRKKGSGVVGRITVGDGWYKGTQFYGAFIEFGHATRPRAHTGSRLLNKLVDSGRGKVAPNPFVGRGINAVESEVLNNILASVKEGLEAICEK
jgi:hypothetical protein